jgi:hypothetical protein
MQDKVKNDTKKKKLLRNGIYQHENFCDSALYYSNESFTLNSDIVI